MSYAITITTKDADINIMHDYFRLKCEEFMKQQYKNRTYKLKYEYANHSTKWHAHGTIDTHFLPKNNRLIFFTYLFAKFMSPKYGSNI